MGHMLPCKDTKSGKVMGDCYDSFCPLHALLVPGLQCQRDTSSLPVQRQRVGQLYGKYSTLLGRHAYCSLLQPQTLETRGKPGTDFAAIPSNHML